MSKIKKQKVEVVVRHRPVTGYTMTLFINGVDRGRLADESGHYPVDNPLVCATKGANRIALALGCDVRTEE